MDNLTEGLVNYYSQLWNIAKEPIVKYYREPTPQMKQLAKLMPDDRVSLSEKLDDGRSIYYYHKQEKNNSITQNKYRMIFWPINNMYPGFVDFFL